MLDWSAVALDVTLAIENPPARIGEAFLSVQHAIQWMLNPRFLDAYNRALYDPGKLDRRRHFDPIAHEDDRELMVTWGVRDIVWPAWNPIDGRFDMLAPFPVPLIQWGHRIAGIDEPIRPAETRSPLHMPEMAWHPQYILVCSVCTWPQGPRGAAAILNSKVPGLRSQLGQFPGIVTVPVPREDLRVGTRLPLVIEYEVWGGLAEAHRPSDRLSDCGFERFSRTGGVLDQAMRLTPQPDVPELRRMQEEHLREDLTELAAILKLLKCRRCTATGCVRYLPQFTLPVTLTESPAAQADRARKLANRLAAARATIGEDPLVKSVLWLPGISPRQRVLDIAKRIAYARVLATRPSVDTSVARWLFATWVHEKSLRIASWENTLDRLDFPADWALERREKSLAELDAIRALIRGAVGRSRPGQVIGPVFDIFDKLSKGSAQLIQAHYQKVLAKALEDFRTDHG